MQLQVLGRHGRTMTLALVATLAVGGCGAFTEEPLAVVPPARDTEGARRGDRAPRDGKAPRSTQAAQVEDAPRATPATLQSDADRQAVGPVATTAPDRDDRERAPRQRVVRLRPRPAPGPFSMDLYRAGDFSHQQTKDWCVAGSVQTMLNIMRSGRNDHSAATQARLYRRGRQLTPNKQKLGPIGVDVLGWAALLDEHGFGPYELASSPTRKGAIEMAARAIRETGRPVGLVTWRGAHSWVMSGFTATADPAYQRRFTVTAVYIEDTWYPYVSTIWGASRPPDTLVPVARLAEDYLPYARPRARWPARDGRYLLVMPVLPEGTVVR